MGSSANALVAASVPAKYQKHAEFNDDGGEASTGPLREIVTDYSQLVSIAGLDPDRFEIVGKVHVWTKEQNDGESLHSYFFGFQPRVNAISDEELEAFRAEVRSWRLPRRTPGTGLGPEIASVLNLADMQLGKSEGGGVDAQLERMHDGLENYQAELTRQRRTGRNITELVIVNNGDPFEGIAGNYASQTHTVQGGLRKQQNLVLDVWAAYARELFPQFDKGQFVSVLCNHTEYGRQGGAKNSITSDSDSGGAFLAETLQRILADRPEFGHVSFVIPHDEMSVFTTAAGVPMGFNHGHKIPSSDAAGFEKWLNGQVRGDDQARDARIWITAHRHNFQSWDLGSTYGFSCPSCDGGSKWLRDTTGRFSRSGIVTMLVGEHHQLGWSDLAFI